VARGSPYRGGSLCHGASDATVNPAMYRIVFVYCIVDETQLTVGSEPSTQYNGGCKLHPNPAKGGTQGGIWNTTYC